MALLELARLHHEEGRYGRAAFYYYKYLFNSDVSPPRLISLLSMCENFDESASLQSTALSSSVDFSIETHVLDSIDMNIDKNEALLYLASFCKNSGQHSVSVKYCNRLLDYGGQESVNAKALLREMRNAEGNTM